MLTITLQYDTLNTFPLEIYLTLTLDLPNDSSDI